MAAIYHAQLITTIPYYDTGHVASSANVMHWQGSFTVNLTNAQLTQIQLTFDQVWSTNWAQLGTTSNHYLGSWVIDMSNSTGGQVTNAAYAHVPGTSGSVPVGDQVAALISLRGTLRYRGGHGRIYVPGLSGAMLTSNGATWSGPTLPSLDALWTNTVTAMAGIAGTNGGPFTPVIWHKKLKSNPNSVEPIATHVSQAVTASQRRRVRKVSRHRTKTVTTP